MGAVTKIDSERLRFSGRMGILYLVRCTSNMTDLHKKVQTNIIVLTGVSSPEKTAIVDRLRALGYSARKSDVATVYIEELKTSYRQELTIDGIPPLEKDVQDKFDKFTKEAAFSNEILNRKLAYEQSLDINLGTTIIDSSLACGMIYPDIYHYSVEQALHKQINERLEQYRYKQIFFFDRADMSAFYANPYESEPELEYLNKKFPEHYAKLGYTCIRVPAAQVTDPALTQEDKINLVTERRVQFMIEQMQAPAASEVNQGTKWASNHSKGEWLGLPSQRAYQGYRGTFFKQNTPNACLDEQSSSLYSCAQREGDPSLRSVS